MFNRTKLAISTLITTSLAVGMVGAAVFSARPVAAQMIGGGGTCTPHPITYQQFIPGYYNKYGVWIPSHYETRSRMSTECNAYNPPFPPPMTNLTGSWYTSAHNSGATTYITQTGFNNYQFTRSNGTSASGYLSGNQVVIPKWNLTGSLENFSNRILWSNGNTWTRYANPIGNTPNVSIPFGNSGASVNIHL